MFKIVAVVGLVIAAVALYFEIYFYEGVHLGRRVQGWLYDQWAAKYDQDKQNSQAQDEQRLAQPLLASLEEIQTGGEPPLVLDVATGTGRLPLALLSAPAFSGRVMALDISKGMLVKAAEKLAPHKQRVTLMRHAAWPLPFAEDTFDVVCCLEALELMPNRTEPLAELARVLRPGGILITSRGTEASGRVGQVCSAEKFEGLLHQTGFERVEIQTWWKMFDLVWARKPGHSTPQGDRSLTDVLRCPGCGLPALTTASSRALRCQQCNIEMPITSEGIVLRDV